MAQATRMRGSGGSMLGRMEHTGTIIIMQMSASAHKIFRSIVSEITPHISKQHMENDMGVGGGWNTEPGKILEFMVKATNTR